MADFFKAYPKTHAFEGGYVDDPADRGGETYKGVARKRNKSWQGWKVIDSYKGRPDFPQCLESDSTLQACVKKFYKVDYWDAMNLDQCKYQDIAEELYDTGVNMGTNTAVIMLQRVLNVANRNERDYEDLKKDGDLGKVTLAALHAHPSPTNILRGLNALQGARYIQICENNPTQERFFNGWIKRVFEH